MPAVGSRLALGVEYDGSGFCGWEKQRHCDSVQAELERALSFVANHPIRVTCAGRTDAGVHAVAQVVHFDALVDRPERAWVLGTNTRLPSSVSVSWCRLVHPDFHARFSATDRRYRYLLLNRRARPALMAGRVGWDYRPLDARCMHTAALALIGEHDFSAFRASGCQARTSVRTVKMLGVERRGELVVIEVVANAFLQHMVRNIVGVLATIGAGERPVEWAEEVLRGRDRRKGGVTASPDGLYLLGVSYPGRFRLPVRAHEEVSIVF